MKKFIFALALFAACVVRADITPPPAATQAEVNAGLIGNKYVSPKTLANSTSSGAVTNVPYYAVAFIATNFPQFNGKYLASSAPVVITNNGNIDVQFTYTNTTNANIFLYNDSADSFYVLTTNLSDPLGTYSYLNSSVSTFPSESAWEDTGATPVSGHLIFTQDTNVLYKSIPLTGLGTGLNDIASISPVGSDSLGITENYPFKSNIPLLFSCWKPFSILLSPGLYNGFTCLPNQSIYGDPTGLSVVNAKLLIPYLPGTFVNNITGQLSCEFFPFQGLNGVSFFNDNLTDTTLGGDTFQVNIFTNCTWNNCYISCYENGFQGDFYGTNYVYNTTVTCTAQGSLVGAPVFGAQAYAATNSAFLNWYGGSITLDHRKYTGSDNSQACIRYLETNAVFNLYGVSLIHYDGTNSKTAAINDQTGTEVFNGYWTDNGTNMIGYGVAGKTGYIASTTISTNVLVVSASGVTNNSSATYLLTITAGTGMSLKDGNGSAILTPAINGAYPLKPNWRFTGTTVTAQAVQQ